MTAGSTEPTSDGSLRRPRGRWMPRGERRAQLLESARDAFVAHGYHAAAMDEIAERAGVSKPVLYQHFPGKLDLYLAVLDAACDTVVGNCREALASTQDNKQRVAATVRAFYDFVGNDTGSFRLVYESDLTSEPAVRERVDRTTTDCATMVAEVIAEDTGLPGEAAHLLAVSLVGMAQVSARFWLDESSPIELDRAATLVAGLAWRGIAGHPLNEEN